MKKNSNISHQIKNLKERKQFDTLWDTKPSLTRINRILKKLNSVDPYEKQIYLKYIVVNLVSIIESFTRSSVKKLIDFGDPYLDNSKVLFDNKIKMDFESFKFIHKKEFSIGEFVSHQISCSKLEDLLNIFNIILAQDLFNFFKSLNFPDNSSSFNNAVVSYINENDLNNKSIQRIFELRHIICHENSLRLEIDEKEVRTGCNAITLLLNICGDAINYNLNPILYIPFKEQISICQNQLERQKSILNELIEKIKTSTKTIWDEKIDINLFIETHELWEKYSDKHAQTMSNITFDTFDNKQIIPQLDEIKLNYLEELIFMYEEKIDELKIDYGL